MEILLGMSVQRGTENSHDLKEGLNTLSLITTLSCFCFEYLWSVTKVMIFKAEIRYEIPNMKDL